MTWLSKSSCTLTLHRTENLFEIEALLFCVVLLQLDVDHFFSIYFWSILTYELSVKVELNLKVHVVNVLSQSDSLLFFILNVGSRVTLFTLQMFSPRCVGV